MKLKAPTGLEIRMTKDKGWGVFATEFIAKGSIIEECYVLTIPHTCLAFESTLFKDYRFNWPQGDEAIEQTLPLGFGCVYNHSDYNNAYWVNHPTYDRVFQFIAQRDIYPDEEVCTWYGTDAYWKSDGRQNVVVK